MGVVVPDLELAMSEFTELLGVQWSSPRQQVLPVWTPGETIDSDFRFAYSKSAGGSPLIELIEALPGTPWWRGNESGSVIHHIGFWVDDLEAKSDELEAGGAPIEATLRRAGSGPRLFTYNQLKHGPRIELVDSEHQEAMMAWIDRGAAW
ncbi:VOC family protein [Rhodococcus opacus]